jgi:hypothetical protein
MTVEDNWVKEGTRVQKVGVDGVGLAVGQRYWWRAWVGGRVVRV